MVDVPHFARLLKAVDALGVKLVTLGDGGQLQPVAAGDAFRLVTQQIPLVSLETVIRQEESWQQEATRLFGRQKPEEALKAYVDKGHVTFVKEEAEDSSDPRAFTKKALVNTWQRSLTKFPQESAVMLSYTQKDTADLNQQARALMKAQGQIGLEKLVTVYREKQDPWGTFHRQEEKKAFGIGDRILF